jgi:hypothetical protein
LVDVEEMGARVQLADSLTEDEEEVKRENSGVKGRKF